jgi:mannose-6-phosphate isomerase-like protein (cupin superfamily)
MMANCSAAAPKTLDLSEKFTCFSDHWNPRLLAELNGQQVKLVKLAGEFVWHKHDNEDEMFFVLKGKLKMQFRGENNDQIVGENQIIVVPKGVEHCPLTLTEEVHVMLIEPAGTVNTGNVKEERTRDVLTKI